MARPLSFHEIEAFRALMLRGTTVAAARMLHTTQPTISRLITQAQIATELQLFLNKKGRLQPTQEALQLFETIQLYFQGAEKIEQTAAALRESGTGVLRIACTPTLALGVLPVALRTFMHLFPGVHTNVETLGTEHIKDGLLHGLYDIALTNNSLAGDEFRSEVIHVNEAVCVMALKHALADKTSVDAVDLMHYPLLCLHKGDSLGAELQHVLATQKIKISKYLETTYYATVCMFAAEGIGVGVVNPYIAPVFRDRLAVRAFTPAIKVKTYASFSKSHPASTLTDRFLSVLTKHLLELA